MAGTGFPMALPLTARTQVRSVFIPRRSNAGSTGLQKPVPASRCSLRPQHFALAARSSFLAIGQLTSRYNQQSARSSRDFHRTWRSDAIQGFTRRILEIRPRPAMRPRITRHPSSAIVLIALMTSAQGACWSNRSRIGRTSILPIRRRQQAASLATTES